MSAKPTFVPVARTVTESRDLFEVRELISRRYVDHRPSVVGNARDFLFRSRSAGVGGLTIDTNNYRATMAITTEPFESLLVVVVLGGRFDVTAGRQRSQAGTGEALLYLPGASLDVVMDRTTQRVIQLPAEVVGRVAGRSGVDPVDFRFDAMTPVSPAANRLWGATVAYLSGMLGGPGNGGVHPLMLNSAMEAAAAAAVTVFPNTTMSLGYVPGPGRVAPATVRRACAFMEAHAAEPVTLENIAAAAGVGTRALQDGFRRHLDTTPVSYLRRVRLEGAHRDLQAADAAGGDTVAEVAFRWGFVNLGRFAAYYREAFGRRPSQTLQM